MTTTNASTRPQLSDKLALVADILDRLDFRPEVIREVVEHAARAGTLKGSFVLDPWDAELVERILSLTPEVIDRPADGARFGNVMFSPSFGQSAN